MRRFWEEGIWSRGVPGPGYGRAFFTPRSFAQAQPYCNFVVLEPRWLPDDCTLAAPSVRTEGERWSTLHYRVTATDRRLRLKQFLHDWWTLTDAETNLVGPGRPFVAQGRVGFHGRDYKGLQATCWNHFGTQVELSVEEGEFSTAELESICASLVPADPESADQVAAVPFYRISFTVRRRRGPWGADRIAGCTWSDQLQDALKGADMPILVPRDLPSGVSLDSVGWRRSRKGIGGEIQLILRHNNRTDCIVLRGTQPGGTDVVSVPPGPDLRRTYQWHCLEIRGLNIYFGTRLAMLQGRPQASPHGGWIATWQEAGINWQCTVRASQILTPETLRHLLGTLRQVGASS